MVLPLAPKVLLDQPREKVIVLGSCVVVYLNPTLTMHGVAAVDRAFQELSQPDVWITYFSVVEPNHDEPDGSARDAMARVVARHTKHISGAAVVYRGTGFRATVVRSIITAVHWASRATHPLGVFEDVNTAMTWLKKRPHNEALDMTAVENVVRSMMG